MTRIPASGGRGNAPFWTTVAVAALYLPASIAAHALVDPAYAAGRRGVPRAVIDAAGTLPATVVAGALWLVVAGGFLYAFAAELGAMRIRTAWSPPAKGYLILAAGSLLAHPIAGVPLLYLLVPAYTLHRGLRVR
ncbi:abortive infection protein [Halorubrum sp. N11]|uniref:abortive infection protein n=1 Tax=Halorubrum sp. N11 TaxID=3402276 RepID=UPI003EB95CCC